MWKREKKSKYSFWLQKEVKNQILHIFQTSDIIYIVTGEQARAPPEGGSPLVCHEKF